MAWAIEFERAAERELDKLGHDAAARILRFLHDRVARLDDPRALGEALKGARLGSFWKYRVGDYRIIAHIDDSAVRIVVVRLGNRREVYR
jgi:mRNA interferase RelE/StbE